MAKKPTYEELEQSVRTLEKEAILSKNAEEVLRESEELHRITLSSISDAVFIADDTGAFTFICPNVNVIFGYSFQEVRAFANISKLLGNSLFDTKDLESSGEIRNIEKKITDKTGRTHTLLMNVKRASIKGGTVLYTCRDITERKQAEEALEKLNLELDERVQQRTAEISRANALLKQEIAEHKRTEKALRESEEKYRRLFSTVNDVIIIFDVNTHEIFDVNHAACDMYGYNHQEFTQLKVADVSAEPEKSFAAIKKIASGEKLRIPLRYIKKKDGTIFPAEISTGSFLLGNRTLGCAIIRDITERKQAEETLRASENRYRILTENVADGVGVVQDRKFQFVNATFASIYGYTVERLVGMEPIVLFRDDHKERFKELAEELEKGIPVESFLSPSIRGDGREIWVEGRHNIIEWKGRPAVLVTVRDVTESKLRELAMEGEREHLQSENIKLRATLKDHYKFGDIIGKSPAMQEVYGLILKASASAPNVVIYGESGTGKELIARTIHDMSDRREKIFMPVNCGAVPESLFESEFFGHRKGAFTGAHTDKNGFFDVAHGGTLFLDEVGELTLNMQVKLLRAIEGGEFTPMGDNRIKKVDTRIMAATHRNLTTHVKEGLMREDFFYRIQVIPISVPPLRNRKEDIPLLVEHFLQSYGNGKKRPTIPYHIVASLCNYDWPGNVRELQNVLHRYLTLKRLDFAGTAVEQSIEQNHLSIEKGAK
ncbi:MAG: sigma 54-interacting transcriptional regulator, partial [Desulfatiglandales bacterium]